MTQLPSTADDTRIFTSQWKPVHAYSTAFLCLVLGVFLGYLLRGSASATEPTAVEPAVNRVSPVPRKGQSNKEIENLLARLQADPENHDLLLEVAGAYFAADQIPETARYLESALKVKPADVVTRVQLGNLYFYAGDADKAGAEFQEALKSDPANADALFNLGMVKWQAHKDGNGAVNTWKTLLARNPKHPKRRQVERLIAQVQQVAKR